MHKCIRCGKQITEIAEAASGCGSCGSKAFLFVKNGDNDDDGERTYEICTPGDINSMGAPRVQLTLDEAERAAAEMAKQDQLASMFTKMFASAPPAPATAAPEKPANGGGNGNSPAAPGNGGPASSAPGNGNAPEGNGKTIGPVALESPPEQLVPETVSEDPLPEVAFDPLPAPQSFSAPAEEPRASASNARPLASHPSASRAPSGQPIDPDTLFDVENVRFLKDGVYRVDMNSLAKNPLVVRDEDGVYYVKLPVIQNKF